MAWNSRMVSGLDRRNCGPSRFDTLDEVALMIVRLVEPDLVFVVRNFHEPIDIRGIVSSAIHIDPSFSADPFRAALNIWMAARNRHRDVAGILQSNPVLRASVPEGIRRRKFSMTLDFRRSGIIKIKTPMSNIAMMPNPI